MARPSSSSSVSSRQTSAQHVNASGHTPLDNIVNNNMDDNNTATRRNVTSPSDNHDENEHANHNDYSEHPFTTSPYADDDSLLPGGKRSLSSISLQAFSLGLTFATALIFGLQFARASNPIWRLFAFAASLSAFHFLEFWTTATYNLPAARASSFLLFSNGWHYNTAHFLALLEILISNFFFPAYQAKYTNALTVCLGLALVLLGQWTRSVAMCTAGRNFNHIPQKVKQRGHELVTEGIYSASRHPSYAAFFWWAIGTQVLVGNKVCTLGFVLVLWVFFRDRITAEERSLVQFFGRDYEEFRKRTGTMIPFIK